MELNREQIVKALECCFVNRNCNGCSVLGSKDCLEIAGKNALSLIKELAEENEDLKAIAEQYQKQFEEAKADTVRKMLSEIQKRCDEGGIYPAFVARKIDEIAKEMLEGER